MFESELIILISIGLYAFFTFAKIKSKLGDDGKNSSVGEVLKKALYQSLEQQYKDNRTTKTGGSATQNTYDDGAHKLIEWMSGEDVGRKTELKKQYYRLKQNLRKEEAASKGYTDYSYQSSETEKDHTRMVNQNSRNKLFIVVVIIATIAMAYYFLQN